MDLREIAEKADEYLAEVLATDSNAAAGSWLYRLMALEHVAKIKQIAAQQAQMERQVPLMYEGSLLPGAPYVGPCGDKAVTALAYSPPITCTLPHGHLGGHSDGTASWTHGDADPVKSAVDRLHELVSYARENSMAADAYAITPQEHQVVAGAKAYKDMADKLEEILREGSL